MKKQIVIKALFDKDGKHTCAKNIKPNGRCPFLGVKKLGTVEVCLLNPDSGLLRRDEGYGYLIPDRRCCIFYGKTK